MKKSFIKYKLFKTTKSKHGNVVILNRHFAIRQKVLNSEPIVYKPIIELQKNCESTEIIIFRSFMKKTNIYQLKKFFIQFVNI